MVSFDLLLHVLLVPVLQEFSQFCVFLSPPGFFVKNTRVKCGSIAFVFLLLKRGYIWARHSVGLTFLG